jgi:hypothetical protein
VETVDVEIPRPFAGPPGMGHGGYVAGLLAERVDGPAQITLRRPTPLDTPLRIEGLRLVHGDELIAEAEAATRPIDVRPPPTVDEARAAEPGSPSHFNGRGVHPTCFGCGLSREGGLRIAAAPVGDQVAGVWVPGGEHDGGDGRVALRWVVAALDCPGAFAFIVGGVRAGLLGRLVVERYDTVAVGEEHLVTGWQIGVEGRKMFAGTALFGPDGGLRAAARATWFGFPG